MCVNLHNSILKGRRYSQRGFTLIEILIALFIFTILSFLLMGGLRSIISTQSRTEVGAEKLAKLQMAMLVVSRDVLQAVDRPVTNAHDKQLATFIGTPVGFTFTHMGYADTANTQTHSILQRTGYFWHHHALWRKTWRAVDRIFPERGHQRLLMPGIESARFDYLDKSGHFQSAWPARQQGAATLPRGVRVTLEIKNWGTISQYYPVAAGFVLDASN